MIGLVGAIVLPSVAVWAALRAWQPDWVSRSPIVRAVVATCLGLGASGLTSFWVVAAGGQFDRTFVALDLIFWASLAVVPFGFMRRRRASLDAGPPATQTANATRVAWWLKAAFCGIAALSIGGAIVGYGASPHGDWDAWAIWNQKARFLLRAGEAWAQGLTIGWSQPGHPLLLPSSVARLWAYSGEEATLAPALVGMMFGGAAVAVVIATLGPQRPRAWIGGAVLLAPGVFPREWTAQQADIPFAFFMVTSLAMLVRAQSTRGRDRHASLLLCGAAAGMAAWTKNEGLVLVGVTAVIASATALRGGHGREAFWWLGGAVPGLATLAWFKLVFAPDAPYYLPDSPLPALLEQRFFSDHVGTVNSAIWQRLLAWGGPWAPGAMLATGVLALAAAFTPSGSAARSIVIAIATMASAYYAVYVLTALDVTWLIATTFDRLLVQLWPSVVLAAFLITRHEPARVTQAA